MIGQAIADGLLTGAIVALGAIGVSLGLQILRFAHVPGHEPSLVPDFAGRLGGRGTWVHPRGSCLKRAVRGGFARTSPRILSYHTVISPEAAERMTRKLTVDWASDDGSLSPESRFALE